MRAYPENFRLQGGKLVTPPAQTKRKDKKLANSSNNIEGRSMAPQFARVDFLRYDGSTDSQGGSTGASTSSNTKGQPKKTT